MKLAALVVALAALPLCETQLLPDDERPSEMLKRPNGNIEILYCMS